MQAAPLPENESTRLAELQRYKILDTPPDEGFDNLAKLAAHICGTPIALVSLIDADRQWFKAKVGIDASETPRDIAFCAHAIHAQEVLVVPDAAQDTRFADNPLVTADPKIRFYAGMPLITPSGQAMGTLCVIDRTPKQLTDEQLNALRMLGRQVVSRLQLRLRQQELEQSHAQLIASEQTKTDIVRAIEYGLQGVAFLNQNGFFTYVNQPYAATHGYQPSELLGRSWKTLYSPEWVSKIEQQCFPTLMQSGRWTGEVTGLSKSGHQVFTEISLVRSESDQDPDRWLISTCRNLTERATIQRRLEAEQKSLAQAQALAHVGSWESCLQTGTETWSDEQFRIFGYEPHAITPTIATFRQAVHPDDRPHVHKAIEDALAHDHPYNVTCRILRPNGDCRHLQCHGTVSRDSEGRATHMIGTVQDITEQRALEQILNDHIHRLNLATVSGGIGIWDYYIPENKLVWDKAMYALYGYTEEDFPGAYEAWTSRLHPEDRAPAESALQAAIEGRAPFDTEFRLILPNSVIRHIKASATVLRNEQGAAVRMIGVNYDVTVRKETEEALTKFKSTLDQTLDCVFMFDPTTLRFTYCNRGACEQVGYSQAELLTMTPLDLKSEFTEASYRALLKPLVDGQQAVHIFETVHRHKDGHTVPVEISVQFVQQPGQAPHFVNIVRDITARKQAESGLKASEERLNLALTATQVGIFEHTHSTDVLYWSPILRNIYGLSLGDQASLQHYTDLIHPEDREQVLAAIGQAHDPAGNGEFQLEHRIVRADGAQRYLSLRSRTYFVGEGTARVPTRTIGTVLDITARKQAEDQFRLVVEAAPNGILVANEQGRITMVNAQVERWFGYERQALIGQPIEILLPERYRAHHPGQRTGFFHNPQARAMGVGRDLFGRRKDGSEFPLEIGLSPIQTPQGKQVLASIVDITARKQAEDQFRLVVEAAPNGILVANEQGRITMVNAQVERWFGYERQALIGQPIEILLPERYRAHHPGQRTGFFHNPQARAMGVGRDLFGRRKDGSEFPLEIGLSPIQTPQGKQVLASIVDITARKQAEAALLRKTQLMDLSSEAIFVWELGETIVEWNRGCSHLYGYPAEEAVGTSGPTLLKTEFPLPFAAIEAQLLERGSWSGELRHRTRDGREVIVESRWQLLVDGERRFVLEANRDITDRKQADVRLQEAAQELATKNIKLMEANQIVVNATRAKSEFLATMSHEIRTPMNAIVGMAELLHETPLTPDQANYVGRFSRAANSLMDLINSILDLSKIEAGYMTMESIPFDIHQLTDTIAELMAGKALAKQLELLVFVHPDVPVWLLGDPTRLNQILVNLVGNAIKFTESGHVMIKVEPAHDPSSEQALRFSVSDTGIGIAPDKLQTIFEPFTQVDSTTTRKYGGTGLGLTISHQLVTLMGGHLMVDSTPHVGSTFSFVIQLAKTSAPPTHEPGPTIDLQGRHILIVDDNDTNLMIIREHLARTGVHLVEAASAESCLKLLVEAHRLGTPFDLAILDFHMPGMDGLQLAEALRARPEFATLPLIMHVSDLQREDAQRAQALGIKNYLYKPLSRRRLIESLGTALHHGSTDLRPLEQVRRPEPSLLPSCHILLVEDLEDNRDVINLFLKDTGYHVETAENGAVAVQKFTTHTYDLVLMDMQMPVMDGLQATMVIREWERAQQRRPTPIVALTANAFKEEAEKSLSAGCTAHVTKPIKKKTLLTTITQYATAAKDQAA